MGNTGRHGIWIRSTVSILNIQWAGQTGQKWPLRWRGQQGWLAAGRPDVTAAAVKWAAGLVSSGPDKRARSGRCDDVDSRAGWQQEGRMWPPQRWRFYRQRILFLNWSWKGPFVLCARRVVYSSRSALRRVGLFAVEVVLKRTVCMLVVWNGNSGRWLSGAVGPILQARTAAQSVGHYLRLGVYRRFWPVQYFRTKNQSSWLNQSTISGLEAEKLIERFWDKIMSDPVDGLAHI